MFEDHPRELTLAGGKLPTRTEKKRQEPNVLETAVLHYF